MKQFLSLILALALVGASFAQTTYESPHVKDGKTMQLIVPADVHKMEDLSSLRNTVFSTEESFDFEANEFEDVSIGLFTVSHMLRADESLESLLAELNKEINSGKEDLIVIQAPEISQSNGRKTLRAGFKGNLIEEDIDRMYVNVFEF